MTRQLIVGGFSLYNNVLNEEDLKNLLQLIGNSSFKGDAIDRVFELKQKLLTILSEITKEK